MNMKESIQEIAREVFLNEPLDRLFCSNEHAERFFEQFIKLLEIVREPHGEDVHNLTRHAMRTSRMLQDSTDKVFKQWDENYSESNSKGQPEDTHDDK